MKLCGFDVGPDRPFFLIAGPCVVESEALVLEIAGRMQEITRALGIPYIFKASLRQGEPLVAGELPRPRHRGGPAHPAEVKRQLGVPVLTDVHEDTPLAEVAAVVDVLQTPAFLCRQTNFILSASRAGQAGQHQEGPVPVAVGDAERRRQGALDRQRADHGLRARLQLRLQQPRVRHALARRDARDGRPVVFDATHSVQLPGGQGSASGGQREFVPVLARAAVAAGVSGLFMETHPDPAKALSDGPNAWPLDRMRSLLEVLQAARRSRQIATLRGIDPMTTKIVDIKAREIIDSRGNPTVEADVFVAGGVVGRAAVPSGASTGTREAVELRDGDKKRYLGKGVLQGRRQRERRAARRRCSATTSRDQRGIDATMIALDGTETKARLGANALLAVSLAAAHAAARAVEAEPVPPASAARAAR